MFRSILRNASEKSDVNTNPTGFFHDTPLNKDNDIPEYVFPPSQWYLKVREYWATEGKRAKVDEPPRAPPRTSAPRFVSRPGSRRDSRPVAGRKVRSARSCRIACSLFGVEFVDCSRLEAYFSSRRSARPLQTQSAPRRRRRRRPGGGPGLEPAGGARPQSNAVRRITTMSANRSQFVSSLESKASAHNQTQSARRRRRRRRRRPGGCVRVCVRARCAACFGCVRA